MPPLRQILFVPLLLAALTSACRSPAQKLDGFLKEGRFAEARALLEEEQAGATVGEKATAESVALRDLYTTEIETSTRTSVDQLSREGATHRSRDLARERFGHCPWSVELAALLEECEGRVATIRAMETSWAPLQLSVSTSASHGRRFLAEVEPNRPWIMDSEQLRGFELAAIGSIVLEWADVVGRSAARLSAPDKKSMRSELNRIGITDAELGELDRSLSIVERLPETATEATRLSQANLEALREARSELGVDGNVKCHSRLAPIVEATWAAVVRWTTRDMPMILESKHVSWSELAEAEAWTHSAGIGPMLRSAVARAHVQRAHRRAPQGNAATLALVHLDRARQLGLDSGDAQWAAAESLALATRANSPPPLYRLEIDLGPKVEPEVRSLVLSALNSQMGSPDDALAILSPTSAESSAERIAMTIDQCDLVFDIGSLQSVESRYFSHFETVANPRKAQLAIELQIAESNVDSKKRAYNWAVNSHNAWPTQYSLNNVNWSYTAYTSAVNHYNFVVGLYNTTSSTITQSVYLPYMFQQGTIRYGWRLSATVRVGPCDPFTATHESIASDFVRLGNKGGDEVEAYRADDGIDIDISAEAGIAHLGAVIERLKAQMNGPVGGLASVSTADLEREESGLLGWLHHPWGIQPALAAKLGVPDWARASPVIATLRRRVAAPPPQALVRSPSTVPAPLDPEAASTALAKFVCLVRSIGKHGEATGTGTLIGPNGLVLTCAHVFIGPEIKLEFAVGPWKGAHAAEVLFVNEQRDVAIVRARQLVNSDWADVRIDELSVQGEPIVAIGNPSINFGGQNIGSMSVGIVSNAELTRGQKLYVSADIAIAQGSSGGPLFSLKDGAVIGVVQLVATRPGIPTNENEVAASGFSCLAAPAHMLREWLGLHRPIQPPEHR